MSDDFVRTSSIISASLLAFSLIGVLPVQAQTVWNGGTSNNWSTPGNWTPAVVPGTATSVQINTATPNPTVVGAAGAQANQLTLGQSAGQTGNLTVTGAGSTLALTNTGGFFLVGNFGTGQATVSNGATLTTFASAIGNQAGSTGTMTITGTGSQWNLTPYSAFHVGSSGTGTLNITAGGKVASSIFGMDIGVDNGAIGNVLVSGAGSQLTVPSTTNIGAAAGGTGTIEANNEGLLSLSTVTVGSLGRGTLNLSSGADLTASQVTIGDRTLGNSTWTGAGTTAAITNALRVGLNNGGTGTLNVESGAVVTSSTGAIGTNTGATGAATVTGANSRWTMTGGLTIGQATNSGSGALSVLNGGRVDAQSFVGHNSAVVNLDGSGSQLNLLGFSPTATTFTLGGSGTNNRLNVTGGAHLATQQANLTAASGVGVIANIAGTGTIWDATTIRVGGAGNSSVAVADGAVINVNTGSKPDFVVDGANARLSISTGARVLQGDLSANRGQFTVAESATGVLAINSGGQLTSRFSVIGERAGSNGSAAVTGAGSTWINRGVQVGFGGTASLEITNGATVQSSGSSTLAFSAGSHANVLVRGPGSRWVFTPPPPLSGISNISVGRGGTATMRVEDGAYVQAQGIGVGASGRDFLTGIRTRGTGSLIVTGPATRVDLNVGSFQSFDAGGDGGTGTIEVLNGAVVTVVGNGHFGASTIYTGETPQQLLGHGTLTVDGVGSRVTYTQTLDIGEQATGVLNIRNGGFVSNSDGYLGSLTNSVGSAGSGTATVTGAGSVWQNNGFLRVGDRGTGVLDVLDGARVTNTDGVIANAANSVGTATVSGANSTWASSGSLTVGNLGAATLNLLDGGVASSTGPVAVNALSTINIGTGGTAGTLIAPSVANSGLIRFNHTGTHTFAPPISGSGAVVKDGAGTTIFTANNTYTGLTTIANGTLRAGAVNSFSAGSAHVLSGGTVLDLNNFSQSIGSLAGAGSTTLGTATLTSGGNHASTLYSGVISGTGGVTKAGTGIWTLSGTNTYTGATTVNTGSLIVNGSIASSSMTSVNSGALLGGTGTVGSTTLNSGGTIAPGYSIGTLNVSGNIAFAPGSIYQVEVNDAGQADRIAATGTATINGGTVQVLAGAGNYAPATTYTILSANGGRSGAFTGVTSNLAFLAPSLTYDPNTVYLTLMRNNIDFATIGGTRNQRAAGGGVETLGFGHPIYNAVLQLDAPSARTAFDAVSGEIHASGKTALIEDSRFVRNAAIDRLRAAFDAVGALSAPVMAYGDGEPHLAPATTDRFAVWGQGFGSWGRTDSDGNAARLSRSTSGFLIGADGFILDSWRLGLLGGYSRTDFDVTDRRSSGSSDNYHLGLYGGTQWGALALRAGLARTWHDISTSRNVAFPGFADSLKGNYNAGTTQVFGELGYGIRTGRFGFEPFANLAHVSLHTDGFREKGGATALSSAGATIDTTFTTLGLRASTDFALGGVIATAKGSLGWRHAFGDSTPLAAFNFAGGGPFTIAGVPIARDAAVVEAGLDLAVTPAAALGVSYGGQFASGAADQSIRANLSVRF